MIGKVVVLFLIALGAEAFPQSPPLLSGRQWCALVLSSTLLASLHHDGEPSPEPLVFAPPPSVASTPAEHSEWIPLKDTKGSEVTVEVFREGWLSRLVASRMKERLEKRFQVARSFPDWQSPGVRIPIAWLAFQKTEDAKLKVRLKGPFFDLTSDNAFDESDLESGRPISSRFSHRIVDPDQQGVEMRVEFQLQWDDETGKATLSLVTGSIRAFGPVFSHEENFRAGPWEASSMTPWVNDKTAQTP
jgi:hypothetical protein